MNCFELVWTARIVPVRMIDNVVSTRYIWFVEDLLFRSRKIREFCPVEYRAKEKLKKRTSRLRLHLDTGWLKIVDVGEACL